MSLLDLSHKEMLNSVALTGSDASREIKRIPAKNNKTKKIITQISQECTMVSKK